MSNKQLVPVNLFSAASAPSIPSPQQGDLYFDTVGSQVYVYNGTNWVAVGGGSGTVTSVATGTGLTGGPITTTGTISLDTTSAYVVPDQSGQSGKYLTTNGTVSSWATPPGYTAPTLGSTTIASGATVSTIADLKLTSPRLPLAFNAQTGTSYNLQLSDSYNVWVTCDNAAAITVNVPAGVFAQGDTINVQQIGAGQVTFAQSGTTITSSGATASAPKLRARYCSATIICTATNTFTIVGDIS